jgi:hypothetical protein
MNTMRIVTFATLAAAGLALTACGGGADEEPQPTTPTTNVEDLGAPANMTEVPVEAPPATRIDNANTEALPPQADLTTDDQTRDDADATGMTARVSRDEGGNEAQPAE